MYISYVMLLYDVSNTCIHVFENVSHALCFFIFNVCLGGFMHVHLFCIHLSVLGGGRVCIV